MSYPNANVDNKYSPFQIAVFVGGIIFALIALFVPLIAIGIICLLIILYVVSRNPFLNITVILIIFAAFPLLVTIWPQVAEFRFTIIKDVLYLFIILTGYLLFNKSSNTNLFSRAASFLAVYLVVLVMYWALTSPDHLVGLVSLRGHVEFILLALIIPAIIRPGDSKRIMITLLSITSIIALTHIIDFGVSYKFIFNLGGNRTLFNEINPNVLGTIYAMHLVVIVSMGKYLVRGSRNKYLSLILLRMSFATLAVALVISLSRRNMLAFLIAFVIGLLLLKKNITFTRRIFIMATIVLIAIVIFRYIPEKVQDRLKSSVRTEDRVNAKRVSEIEEFASEYLTNISILFGGKGFGSIGSDNIIRGDSGAYYHNYYIILISDSGIMGLIIFFCACGYIMLRPINIFRSNQENHPINIALFQGIFVVLFGNIFGTTIMTIPVNIYFWTFMGLMIYSTRNPYMRKRV